MFFWKMEFLYIIVFRRYRRVVGLNLVNVTFLLHEWKELVRLGQLLPLRTANCIVVNFFPLLVRIGDLGACTLFWIAKSLGLDASHRTSSVRLCICWILSTERTVLSWHLRPVTIILATTASSSIIANNNIKVLNVNSIWHDGAIRDNHNLCYIVH